LHAACLDTSLSLQLNIAKLVMLILICSSLDQDIVQLLLRPTRDKADGRGAPHCSSAHLFFTARDACVLAAA
jgi:hypothetical protein